MALEQWLVDGQKTIDIERVRRVKASLVGGSIAVLAHAEPQARVEVSSTSVRNLKVAIDGDTLIIDHPQLDLAEAPEGAKTLWKGPKAEVSVLVPANCDIDIKAATAEVVVVGISGDVKVVTAGGEQFVDGGAGSLSLSSVDAEISVREHRGAVSTKTVAGDVTVSGEITRFSGNTVTGATVLDITGGQPDKIGNRSVSGATTIRIPADVTPKYRIGTLTAAAHLEGETVQPTPGQSYASPIGDYERDVTEISLHTVAGRITVVRTGDGDRDRPPAALEANAGGAPDAPGTSGGSGAATKTFRRIVKPDFDSRIDERVASASDQLGVEPDADAGAGSADGTNSAGDTAAGTEATS